MSESPGMQGFEVGVTASRTRAIVRPVGDLDMSTVEDFEQAVRSALDGYQDVVIDLRELRFMDTQGLWALIRASRRARVRSIALRLVPGTGLTNRLFDLTRTRELFEFVDLTGDGERYLSEAG